MGSTYSTGKKIKFKEERFKYTIQACSDRYLICTKPFNLKKIYLYTIVDLKKKIRGTDNYVFSPHTYNTKEGSEIALQELISRKMSISNRNKIGLNIE